tara:strand:+ start:1549 stop:2025 length:477 start_codon:yes stop_codon:yes gene_type:complete
MKITLNKWLNIKNKYTNIQIKDIINILFNYLYHYITKIKELNILSDIDTFYKKFTELIYNKYVYPVKNNNILENTNNENYFDSEEYLLDYFECKYSEDIVNIFLHFKDITYNYNFDLFHNKNDTSDSLLEFLFYNCHPIDPYINEEITSLEETIHIYE